MRLNTVTLTSKTLLIMLGLVLLFGPGCGGGSIGTGTEPRTTFSGSVTSERGAPIAGATIKLLTTGEQTTTIADGSFFLASTISSGDAQFEVTAEGVTGNFEIDVDQGSDGGAAFNLALTLNLQMGTVVLDNLSLTAKIQGVCDPYFENRRIIRQANAVPEGTNCPFRVRASAASGPVSGLKFVLQRKRCFDGAPWHDVGSGVTGTAGPGHAELDFRFSNDAEHCVYRLLVPVDAPGIPSEEFLVETFQKQAFDSAQAEAFDAAQAEAAANSLTPTPTATATPTVTP